MRGLVMLMLVACKGTTVPTGETGDTDDTDLPVPTPVETECDDQIDDDGDGAIDCADTDCQALEFCSWPQGTIRFDVDVQYTASGLAQLAGYNSCRLVGTMDLVRDREASCPTCDRVFCGDFAYSMDNCAPDIERPVDGCFGFTFTTDTSWVVKAEDVENSTYVEFATFNEGTTAGTLEYVLDEDVVVEGFDGGSYVATFELTAL